MSHHSVFQAFTNVLHPVFLVDKCDAELHPIDAGVEGIDLLLDLRVGGRETVAIDIFPAIDILARQIDREVLIGHEVQGQVQLMTTGRMMSVIDIAQSVESGAVVQEPTGTGKGLNPWHISTC